MAQKVPFSHLSCGGGGGGGRPKQPLTRPFDVFLQEGQTRVLFNLSPMSVPSLSWHTFVFYDTWY